MKKLMIILAMMVLMIGVVSADRVISDVTNITVPVGVVAGSPFEAEFSFSYPYGGNVDGSPLIIQLNITSKNESYPVGKGEFVISGRVEKSWLGSGLFVKSVEFNCSEEYAQTIEHPQDAAFVVAPDGTFYCYNKEGDLQLEERDDVYLNIVSHYAIYPGEYELSTKMYYLEDERAPFVEILNVDAFDLYYRELDNIEVWVTIDDGSGIKDYPWGTIFANYDITVPFSHKTLGINYFTKVLPIDILEDDYDLFIFAEDEYNNSGNDSVTLKIDRTAPEIILIQPSSNSTYGENDSLIIEVGAVDVKAGLDSSSVMYRISEIVNGSFCPDSGEIFGNYSCYNSGWVADWDSNFETELNINGSDFVSGSYWLEAGACDILGNCGVL